jgi:hypothetical protein
MGAHQHTDEEHSHKTWQPEPAEKGVGQKTGENYEGEAESQENLLSDP